MSALTVKNEAFLDLEDGMIGQLEPVWAAYWARKVKGIGAAVTEERWGDAHALVEEVNLKAALKKREPLVRTLGMAALLMGASRLGRIDRTSVFKTPPADWLDAAVAQHEILVGENATLAMRQELHLLLDKHEYAYSSGNSSTMDDVQKAVKGKNKYVPVNVRNARTVAQAVATAGSNRGTSYIGLAANLHISRLSSAGFLLEAVSGGLTTYQVSEVLDRRTCPVCQQMHGRSFSVSSGVDHLSRVFSAGSSAALQAISPWPRQNKAGLAAFSAMDNAALVDAGFHLPPYHPGCRGILVSNGTVPTFELEQEVAGLIGGSFAGDALGDRLFGNRDDIDATSSILFPEGATSALYNLSGPGAALAPLTDEDEEAEDAADALSTLQTVIGKAE